MESWGFESYQDLPGRSFGLFQEGPPPVGNRSGGAGKAKKSDEAVIAVKHDKLPDQNESDLKADLLPFVAKFVIDDPSAKKAKDKQAKSGQERTYRLWYHRDPSKKEGASGFTPKEAKEIQEKVDGLKSHDELIKKDETPKILYYEKDKNGDHKLSQDKDASEIDLDRVKTMAADVDQKTDSSLDPSSQAVVKPTSINLRKIDDERADAEALISMLLNALASGNVDVLPALFDALARKSGLTVAEVAAKTAEALGMADKEAAELGKKFADAYKNSDDPKRRAEMNGELKKLEILYQQNGNRREQLAQTLRQTLGLNDKMSSISEQIHAQRDRSGQMRPWG